MAQRMPPPGTDGGKGGVAIVIAPHDSASSGGRMPPPGSPGPSASGKVDPAEAQIVREDQHCIDCENYSVDDGTCAKIDGQFAPQDACVKFFTPVADDEQSEGEPPGGGGDDSVSGDGGDGGGDGGSGGAGQP